MLLFLSLLQRKIKGMGVCLIDIFCIRDLWTDPGRHSTLIFVNGSMREFCWERERWRPRYRKRDVSSHDQSRSQEIQTLIGYPTNILTNSPRREGLVGRVGDQDGRIGDGESGDIFDENCNFQTIIRSDHSKQKPFWRVALFERIIFELILELFETLWNICEYLVEEAVDQDHQRQRAVHNNSDRWSSSQQVRKFGEKKETFGEFGQAMNKNRNECGRCLDEEDRLLRTLPTSNPPQIRSSSSLSSAPYEKSKSSNISIAASEKAGGGSTMAS